MQLNARIVIRTSRKKRMVALSSIKTCGAANQNNDANGKQQSLLEVKALRLMKSGLECI